MGKGGICAVKDVDVFRIASVLEVDVNELFKEMEKETLM